MESKKKELHYFTVGDWSVLMVSLNEVLLILWGFGGRLSPPISVYERKVFCTVISQEGEVGAVSLRSEEPPESIYCFLFLFLLS